MEKEDIEKMITQLAARVHLDLPTIPIRIVDGGSMTAGGGFVHSGRTPMHFVFCRSHMDHVGYRNTVIHEFAHLLQLVAHGYTDHDPLFLEYYHDLGGVGDIYHDYGGGR
jgi:hypothetical protein